MCGILLIWKKDLIGGATAPCRRSDFDSPRTDSLAMAEDMRMRVVGRDNSWLILLVAADAARLGMYGP
jgi:hypothetical protein